MSAKISPGWFVLAAALALPGALLYHWQRQVEEASRKEEEVRLRIAARPFPAPPQAGWVSK